MYENVDTVSAFIGNSIISLPVQYLNLHLQLWMMPVIQLTMIPAYWLLAFITFLFVEFTYIAIVGQLVLSPIIILGRALMDYKELRKSSWTFFIIISILFWVGLII